MDYGMLQSYLMKKTFYLSWPLMIGVMLTNLSCVDDRPLGPVIHSSNLVINEIVSTGDPDWVEIYNPSSATIDLTGFLIYDSGTINNKFVLNDLQVPPKGFLILFCDDLGSGNHTNFKLSSVGETLWLEDPNGNLVQLIVFPALQSGVSYGRNPDGGDLFSILSSPSQGISNVPINSSPEITSVSLTPQFPSPIDTVQVRANITDDSFIQEATLFYAAGSDTFNAISMLNLGSDFFQAKISPLPEATTVRYYIHAADDFGRVVTRPPEAPDFTFTYISSQAAYTPPRLFINEFLASNSSVNKDPDFNDFSDWIEIYNAETHPVDMSGMYLTDDLATPKKWTIPVNTTISAGGYLLFWADNQDVQQTGFHTNFKLSAGGESVGLFANDIVNNVPIDTFSYTTQVGDISFGRITDGHISFQSFLTPTPGASN